MCGDCNWASYKVDMKALKEEAEKIILSEEDAKVFLEALANPPPPNDKMKEAFRKYHEMDQN